MNKAKQAILFLLIATCSSCSSSYKSNNPLDVAFGDPYVMLATDNTYYMYGTTSGFNGFNCYKSNDLTTWEEVGVIFDGDDKSCWGVKCYWAPEVYERDGKFYLFYSADWKVNPTDEAENFRIGVAMSDSPAGPFKNISDRPLFDPNYPIIDANVHFEDDGRCYLYYSRCCYKNSVESEISNWAKAEGKFDYIEESWIYGVEIEPDFSGVIGEPVLLLRPPVKLSDKQSEWESRSVTSGEVNRRWTEGSYLIKKDDVYYMMYSANYFGGEHYAVGYATSDSPLGIYTKSANNPILEKNTSKGGIVTGTGHNSITTSKDGKQLFCVYHGRTAATGDKRVVFIDKLDISDGKVIIHGPTTLE
ncbi:MAG: glycoside hydrolase family 43 protein [Rikenellaceae bacterium]